MKRIKTLTAMAAASLLACAIPQSASAALVPLAPNTPFLPLAGATIPGVGSLGSPVAGATQSFPISAGVWTGTFAAQAYYNSGSSGPLTFVYAIRQLTGDPADPISAFSVGGFGGSESVGFITSSANPQFASSSPSGTTIGFFGFLHGVTGGIGNGNDAFLVIQTASTTWGFSTATVTDSQSVNFAALSVPEPTTMIAGAMLLLPFAASTLRMVRKNRTA